MVWQIIRSSAADIWDEMLYLMIFNIIWVAPIVLIVQGAILSFLPCMLLGAILLFPWPLVTFGLFFIIYDIGESKGIGFGKFWDYGRRMWKQAYLWGGINLAVLIIAWANLNFYTRIEAQWAALLQVFIIALSLFWIILQLLILSFYPRLEQPGFKLALRNAGVVIGRHPFLIFFLIISVVLILAMASFFPLVMLLGAVSIIAVVTNRVVDVVVKKEKQREQERAV
jgi:uncharacterized membrane protein YesL